MIRQQEIQPVQQTTNRQRADMYEVGPEPKHVVPLKDLGEEPAMIACPHCKHRAMTRVEKGDSSMTT